MVLKDEQFLSDQWSLKELLKMGDGVLNQITKGKQHMLIYVDICIYIYTDVAYIFSIYGLCVVPFISVMNAFGRMKKSRKTRTPEC